MEAFMPSVEEDGFTINESTIPSSKNSQAKKPESQRKFVQNFQYQPKPVRKRGSFLEKLCQTPNCRPWQSQPNLKQTPSSKVTLSIPPQSQPQSNLILTSSSQSKLIETTQSTAILTEIPESQQQSNQIDKIQSQSQSNLILTSQPKLIETIQSAARLTEIPESPQQSIQIEKTTTLHFQQQQLSTPKRRQVYQSLTEHLMHVKRTPPQSEHVQRAMYLEGLRGLRCNFGSFSQRPGHLHQNAQLNNTLTQQVSPQSTLSQNVPNRQSALKNIRKAQFQANCSLFSPSQQLQELEIAHQIATDPTIQQYWGQMEEKQRTALINRLAQRNREKRRSMREMQLKQKQTKLNRSLFPLEKEQQQKTAIVPLQQVSVTTTSVVPYHPVIGEKSSQSSNNSQRAIVVEIKQKDSVPEQEILNASQKSAPNTPVEKQIVVVAESPSPTLSALLYEEMTDSSSCAEIQPKEHELIVLSSDSESEDNEPQREYYGYDPSIKLPANRFLLGSVFWAAETLDFIHWQYAVFKYGGEVETEYGLRVTHVLCETQGFPEFKKCIEQGQRVVTLHWLSDICLQKSMMPPFYAIHLPIPFSREDQPLQKKIYCLSGFVDEDRFRAKKMCDMAGAIIAPFLTSFVDAVVVKRDNTAYYRKAREYKTPVVNIQFLNEVLFGDGSCLRNIHSRKYQNFELEDAFRMNFNLVPQLMAAWETPLRVNIAESCRESWKKKTCDEASSDVSANEAHKRIKAN